MPGIHETAVNHDNFKDLETYIDEDDNHGDKEYVEKPEKKKKGRSSIAKSPGNGNGNGVVKETKLKKSKSKSKKKMLIESSSEEERLDVKLKEQLKPTPKSKQKSEHKINENDDVVCKSNKKEQTKSNENCESRKNVTVNEKLVSTTAVKETSSSIKINDNNQKQHHDPHPYHQSNAKEKGTPHAHAHAHLQHKKQIKNTSTSTTTTEKQRKLNYFLINKSENSLDSTSMMNANNSFAISEYERKKAYLEDELRGRDLVIEKLKTEKEQIYEKYGRLKYTQEETKVKNRKIIEERIREMVEFKRREKREIDVKYGYYKQSGWTIFIEGEFILKAKRKVEETEKILKELEDKRRSMTTKDTTKDNKERLSRNEAVEQLKMKEEQITVYKERLRLADKEASSTFAKQGWPLINDRYLPMELLGSGGFGEVYKCYDLEENIEVALKINCFEPLKGSEENRREFLKHVEREVQILKSLNHPNIARLIEEIQIDDDKISFVMEYCNGPELNKYIKEHVCLEEKEARGIIKQITFALKYLQDQKCKIIHYDLKPANIIFSKGIVKILDFGLCKKMESEDTKIDLTSQGVGTYWYLPPETFKENAEISIKVDVWSVGVIFYEMLYGKRPFGHGVAQTKIFNEGIILKALSVEFPAQNEKKYKVSEEAKEFIRMCLKYHPEDRLDPEGLYTHPYLH